VRHITYQIKPITLFQKKGLGRISIQIISFQKISASGEFVHHVCENCSLKIS